MRRPDSLDLTVWRVFGLDEHVGGTSMNTDETDIPFIDIESTHDPPWGHEHG